MPRSFGKLDRKSRFIDCDSLNTVELLFLQWSDKIVKGFLLALPHSCVLFHTGLIRSLFITAACKSSFCEQSLWFLNFF